MTGKKRILFYGSFTGGGTERITYNLASALACFDEYEIYVMNTRSVPRVFDLHSEVRYCYLHDGSHSPRSIPQIIKRVREFIKCLKFDVVISVEALAGIVLIPATFGSKCKTIVWEHANYFQSQNSRWTRLIRKIWLRYADAYIVLTKRDKLNFETHEHPHCPIVQIYNPVSVNGSLSYDLTSRRIISVGHLVPIKQFHLIPQIFAPLAAKYPEWSWHIFGEGPERGHIESEITRLNLENRVFLEGRNNDIDSEYNRSALYVLTSRMEGLPTVLIEAQKHGLPCVSFDIETGPDEIITDGKSGFLISDYNIEDMTSKLDILISDEYQRKAMSDEARKPNEAFSPETITLRWRSLLSSLTR